jgi:hypothetical protein
LASKFTELSRLTTTTNNQTQRVLEASVAKLTQDLHRSAWRNGNDGIFSSTIQDLKAFISHTDEAEWTLEVVKSLHFKELRERQSEVCGAHRQTFEWIFDLKKNNFASWLQSGNGIYWIEGKPGSGKSTLMNFIINHKRTERLLQEWSGTKQLSIVSHFFWSAGTMLQKSREGLLRSLLFQIVCRFPDLILELLPDDQDRWGKPFSLQWVLWLDWTWADLSLAFKKLACHKRLPSKFCIFIDGLDEYDGDHGELIELLRKTARSTDIKICASSRPWFDFIDAFGHQEWKLSVQDLTAKDILLYINDNLEQNSRFQMLRLQDEVSASELVEEIQTKSCGVFLWVFLVVRSLLRGLQNSDLIPDLRRRLYELPNELERYFELMLNSIEGVYQQKTARIFRVMLASQGALPILTFHFLDQEELNIGYALQDFVPPPLQQLKMLRDEKKRQLHAHCRDLLWVTTDYEQQGVHRDSVSFLHRTVMDFLRTSHMNSLLSTRAGKDFKPAAALLMAHLALLKTQAQLVFFPAHVLVCDVLFYSGQSETQDEIAQVSVLDELQSFSNTLPFRWQDISRTNDCCTFLSYAVRAGLRLYIKEKIQVDISSSSRPSLACELLQHALRGRIDIAQYSLVSRFDREVDLSMISFLLDLGADPNRVVCDNSTVWFNFLLMLEEKFTKERDEMSSRASSADRVLLDGWYKACKLLISHGAKRRRRIEVTSPRTLLKPPTYMYALDLIEKVFTPEQITQLRERYDRIEQSQLQRTVWTKYFPFYHDWTDE